MTRRIRGLIFLIFFFGFFVTAPLVVLYTAGYRYQFGTWRIVQTGVLSLGSTPRGASIWLDGEDTGATTPALLKNVMPGEHEVRIVKDGYSGWEKRLEVNSRATTFADEVVLFLEAEPELLRGLPAGAVSLGPKDATAVYTVTQAQWTEIWTRHPTSGDETLVSRLPSSLAQKLRFEWLLDGEVLKIVAENSQVTETLVEIESGLPTKRVVETDIVLQTVEDRVVVSRDRDGAAEILAYLPLGDYQRRESPPDIVTLEDVQRGRIVLVRATGGDQPILLNENASYFAWEPGGRRLLYSDGFDLHVYDAGTHTDDTITRLSSAITGVGWYSPAEVLFAQDDAIYAAELDHRDGRNIVKLVTGSGLGVFQTDQGGEKLFFFGTVNQEHGLFERRLQR
jgi:hypothetical protein